MQKVENILIVKLSSIGDVVHALHFLEAFKERFPHARIDWLVEEESFNILQGHPSVDRIIVSRRKVWQKKLSNFAEYLSVSREVFQFVKEVRKYPYDLVVDLQGLLRSGILVGISRGKRKIGMVGAREGGGIFLNESPVPVDYEQHAVDRYLEVARYLGCHCRTHKGSIPVSEYELTRVKEIVDRNGLRGNHLVAINPMTRWKTKLWEPEGFAALADRLCDELGCRVVFTGSGQDRKSIKDISAMMKQPTVNLAGQTTLRDLACLFSLCSVVVTTDTGPMHIAAAMGCRVVALFGPTDPRRTGPYGQGHTIIRADVGCNPCFKKKCDHMSCMKQISVERCFETIKDILVYKPVRLDEAQSSDGLRASS